MTNIQRLSVSSQSQRIDIGSADVDWSNWGEDWAESHDHDDQSQWTGWSNEQLTTTNSGWNHAAAADKSAKSRNQTASKPAEKNLIDFDLSDDGHHGNAVATEAVGDGWDAEVWADVDDDNWEPLETPPATFAGKRD